MSSVGGNVCSDKIWRVLWRRTLTIKLSVPKLSLQRPISISTNHKGDCGTTVVKVLCYKSEGRWFDPSWCHWMFHWHNPSDRTKVLGSNQSLTEMSTRGISWGKGDRCVRLTTYHHHVPLSRNLEPSGPLRTCNGTALPLPLRIIRPVFRHTQNRILKHQQTIKKNMKQYIFTNEHTSPLTVLFCYTPSCFPYHNHWNSPSNTTR